ncbi:unnamed protein product [Discosporangium mesarthrocarpum]
MYPLHLTARARKRLLEEVAKAAGLAPGDTLGEKAMPGVGAGENSGMGMTKQTSLQGGPLATAGAGTSRDNSLGGVASRFDRIWALVRALLAAPAQRDIQQNLEIAWATAKGWRDRVRPRGRRIASAAEGSKTAAAEDAMAAVRAGAVLMVRRGAAPAEVDIVCEAMKAACGLGLDTGGKAGEMQGVDTEGGSMGRAAGRWPPLDVGLVYSEAAEACLHGLVSGSKAGGAVQTRARALSQLQGMCSTVAAAASSAAAAMPASRAWGALHPLLERFCRGEGVGMHTFDSKYTGANAPEVEPEAVLRARADILTLIRGYRGVGLVGQDSGETGKDGDQGEGGGGATSKGQHKVRPASSGGDTSVGGGGSVQEGADRLSLSFLRAAEVVMQAFDKTITPAQVGSWEARGVLLEDLVHLACKEGGESIPFPGGSSAQHSLTLISPSIPKHREGLGHTQRPSSLLC